MQGHCHHSATLALFLGAPGFCRVHTSGPGMSSRGCERCFGGGGIQPASSKEGLVVAWWWLCVAVHYAWTQCQGMSLGVLVYLAVMPHTLPFCYCYCLFLLLLSLFVCVVLRAYAALLTLFCVGAGGLDATGSTRCHRLQCMHITFNYLYRM